MADPTIKDVLDAIGALDRNLSGRIDAVDGKIDAVDANLSERIDTLGARIDAVDANLGARIDAVDASLSERIGNLGARIDAHRLETAKGFADLDKELARHSDPVHRRLEEEMAALRKLVMAKKSSRRSAVRRPRQA